MATKTPAAAPCWVGRDEVDPRYDYTGDDFDIPECDDPSCRCAERDTCATTALSEGWHDWECPVVTCRWDRVNSICGLTEGHAGEHGAWTPESHIGLTFETVS